MAHTCVHCGASLKTKKPLSRDDVNRLIEVLEAAKAKSSSGGYGVKGAENQTLDPTEDQATTARERKSDFPVISMMIVALIAFFCVSGVFIAMGPPEGSVRMPAIIAPIYWTFGWGGLCVFLGLCGSILASICFLAFRE